jgi:integrating conjugative element protein (TIGR03759 family)
MNKLSCLFICMTFSCSVNAAENVENSRTQNVIVQNSQTNPIQGTAKDWDLTATEWERYLQLMKGPAGEYYGHLSPPEILGYYAENDTDLRYFAELYVKQEHEKLEREARFDKAFLAAGNKFYEGEPIIKPFDITAYTPIADKSATRQSDLQSGDHLVLFIDIQQTRTYSYLSSLINKIKKSQAVLDIYFVNAGDTATIQSWSAENNVPVDLVASSHITLNPESGQHKNILASHNLPYVLLVRDGKSKPVDTGAF